MVSKSNVDDLAATMIDDGRQSESSEPEERSGAPYADETQAAPNNEITRTPPTVIPDGSPEDDTRYLKADALPDRVEGSDMIGPFQITRKLGQGGMGVVYEAYDANLDRKVAIKVMTDMLAENETARERLKVEAQSAARLNHPNIVSVYAFGSVGESSYIAFEFIEGEDLGAIIRRKGALPLGEALPILRQTVEALRFAWAGKVIHRDIKPANLMVTKSGQIKVADFGLAKRMDMDLGLTATDMILGSPNYMAPEQSSSGSADFRTDIYSLGCTFYMMLMGDAPYKASTPFGVLLAHTQSPLPEPDALKQLLGGRVLGMIHRMMAKKPEDRFTSYDELLATIDELIDLEQGAQPPTIVSQRPSPQEMPTVLTSPSSMARPYTPPAPEKTSKLWYILGGVAVILFGVFAVATLGPFGKSKPTTSPAPATAAAARPQPTPMPEPTTIPTMSQVGEVAPSEFNSSNPTSANQSLDSRIIDFVSRASRLSYDITQGKWTNALDAIGRAALGPTASETNREEIVMLQKTIGVARDRELELLEKAGTMVPFEVHDANRMVRVEEASRKGVKTSDKNGGNSTFIEMGKVTIDLRGSIARYVVINDPSNDPNEIFADAIVLKAISPTDGELQWSQFAPRLAGAPELENWKAEWEQWDRITTMGRKIESPEGLPGGALRRPGGMLPPPRRR
ncbi:serine/threonine protein kinase [bacterium]|nr:serine/threonine protein kinase [bacterium]